MISVNNHAPAAAPGHSDGLTTVHAADLLAQYGKNTIPVDKPHPLRVLLSKFWGPIPWMLEGAVVLETVIHKPAEGSVIGLLLVFNAVMSLVQENRAQEAVALLRQRLAVQARVCRDGNWQSLPASALVPGDLLHLGMGDLVAADVSLSAGDVLIDQSAITGESEPIEGTAGGKAFMGSMIKRGEAIGIVTATGSRSSYGKTAEIVQTAAPHSHLQDMIFLIVRALILFDIALVAIVLVDAFFIHLPLADVVPFCLILLVSSVPAALPATFTLAAALGTQELAKRGVLVTRLAAIEEAASMDILATDKTGTLTQSVLSLSAILPLPPHTQLDVLRYAVLASDNATQDPVDLAILTAAKARKVDTAGFQVSKFTPFDPASKLSMADVMHGADWIHVVKGAPAEIAALVSDKVAPWVHDAEALAAKGYRVLAVAAGLENAMAAVGMISLLDAPREDAAALVKSLHDLGSRVIMVTGDGVATAATVATQVGITGAVCPPGRLHDDINAAVNECDVFAGIFPEDKIHLVQTLQKTGHIVGMTGDGVNDAPALKQAEVGIAVASATDVAKAAASAVLTNPGLGEVVAAIETSRRIYQRMLTYTLKKIVKTLEISLFLTIAVVATHTLIITPLLIIINMFTNDFVTMSIATDNVSFAQWPERWNVRSLLLTALPLSGVSLLMSLVVLFAGRSVLHLGLPQIQTLVFLTLAYNGQGIIYLIRERSHLWHSRPSSWLLTSSTAAIAVVSIMATFGILMAPLSPLVVCGLLGAIALYLFAIDFAKVRIFQYVDAGAERKPH